MTLTQKRIIATIIMVAALLCLVMASLFILWDWATGWSELTYIPANFQGNPSDWLQDLQLLYPSFLFYTVAAFQRAQYTAQLAAVNARVQAGIMPPAEARYIEQEAPDRLPVTLRHHSPHHLLQLGGVTFGVLAVIFLGMTVSVAALTISLAAKDHVLLAVFIALTAFFAAVTIWVSVYCWKCFFRPPIHGVTANEQGIRRVTRREMGPLLVWSDLRLFEVIANQRSGAVVYRAIDNRGRQATWVFGAPDRVEYIPAISTEDAAKTVRALTWLFSTYTSLSARAPGYLPNAADISQTRASSEDIQKAVIFPYFRTLGGLALIFLAIGLWSFQSLLYPAVVVIPITALLLCSLFEIGHALRDWLSNSTQLIMSMSWRWILLEVGLLTLGGFTGLGSVLVSLATVGPQWIVGDVIMTVGLLITLAAGFVLAFRASRFRRNQAAA
jgi:hypothetical protein